MPILGRQVCELEQSGIIIGSWSHKVHEIKKQLHKYSYY